MFDGVVITRAALQEAAAQNLEFLRQHKPIAPFMIVTQIQELADRAGCSVYDLIGLTKVELEQIAHDIESDFRSGRLSSYRAASPISSPDI